MEGVEEWWLVRGTGVTVGADNELRTSITPSARTFPPRREGHGMMQPRSRGAPWWRHIGGSRTRSQLRGLNWGLI